MGIKSANKFLLDNCSKKAIYKALFSQFTGKTIVIDTMIFIYKYESENALIENMYVLVSILRHYNITPVFIFDGKPPAEKKELLYNRRLKKEEAEDKYNKLNEKKEKLDITSEEYAMLDSEMESLKKQFIRVNDTHIQIVKDLLNAYGVDYMIAEGEADVLCAQLVLSGNAWACLSDDMDLFVYGCPRVIRQVSLLNHTCRFYDIELILKDLEMSLDVFRQIMVLSGSDYNVCDNTNLHDTIQWYYKYQNYVIQNEDKPSLTFYDWLFENSNYVQNKEMLTTAYNMFILNDVNNFNKIEFKLKTVNKVELKKILEKDGFLNV